MQTDSSQSKEWKQYVTFTNDDRSYGVEITRVREIRQWSPISELPNQPHYTRGVLNIRGEVIPVHDLRARLGGGLTDTSDSHVVVVVNIGDQNVGILVDAVSDIIDVNAEEVRSVPSGAQNGRDEAVSGLVNKDDHMIALLDLELLFPRARSAVA